MSKYLLRANPALTTNYKLIVDTSYNLYLESYDSNIELSNNKYKKFIINSESFLSERLATFYYGLPTDVAFEVKNVIKSDTLQTDFSLQYDDIYYSGPRLIENKSYQEQFQYNTTLKIDKKLPKYFFIFKTDNSGVNLNLQNFGNSVPNKQKNIFDIVRDFKVCHVVDFGETTSIGKFWQKNYISDDVLPISAFELNLHQFEFSKWNGYDYNNGGTVSKSYFFEDYFQNETTHFDLETFITTGFKRNGIINSNYTNVSFLFNDRSTTVLYKDTVDLNVKYDLSKYVYLKELLDDNTISNSVYTKTYDTTNKTDYITFSEHVPVKKKWAINRYYGFYVDNLIKLKTLSPYKGSDFKLGESIVIVNNRFLYLGADVDPLKNGYNENIPSYIKVNDMFYPVKKNENDQFIIISNLSINDTLDNIINNAEQNIKIEYLLDTLTSQYKPFIKLNNNTLFNPDYINFDDLYLNKYEYRSVYVIEIFDKYYTLKLGSIAGDLCLYLNTDDIITCDDTKFTIQSFDGTATTDVIPHFRLNNIANFNIYLMQFTEISDFDYDRINTDYAKIENNKFDEVNYNKYFLHRSDVLSTQTPKEEYKEIGYNIFAKHKTFDATTQSFIESTDKLFSADNEYVLPISSEYGLNDLFILNNKNELTDIWNLNQSIVKWGYNNSNSANNYPYKLNNSLESGVNNFTPNAMNTSLSIVNLSLDWFITPGHPTLNYLNNKDAAVIYPYYYEDINITFRTLNLDMFNLTTIEDDTTSTYSELINYYNKFKINLNYYINPNAKFDYFSYIFNLPVKLFKNEILMNEFDLYNISRYAILNKSDGVNGSSFFFKGIKGYVQTIKFTNPNDVKKYEIIDEEFEGYKFSTLFDNVETEDTLLHGTAGINIYLNKIYKNILIHIFIYTPYGSITNLHYTNRDNIYHKDITYTNISSTNEWETKRAEIHTTDISITNIIDILNNLKTDVPNFTHGVKYTVIENIKKYNLYYDNVSFLNSITLKYFDSSDVQQGSNVGAAYTLATFVLSELLPYKQGDWIYINGTSGLLDNLNWQIYEKINNNTFTLKLIGDWSILYPLIAINGLTFYVTKENSLIPFKIRCELPEKVYINNKINQVVSEKINLLNKSDVDSYKNLLINDSDIIVPNVYNADDIVRKITTTEQKTDLINSELIKLPYIYRYNGDYEPIIKNVELFNQDKLILYNNEMDSFDNFITNYQILNVTTSFQTANKYRLEVIIKTLDINIKNLIKVNDILYFNILYYDNTYVTNSLFNVINHKMTHIEELEYLDYHMSDCVKIKTDIYFDTNIFNNVDTVTDDNLYGFLFKNIEKNTTFDFSLTDFAKTTQHIIRVYDNLNPMITNSNIHNSTHKYPMIDEIGITEIKRNIFKSNWDNEYYYKITRNKYKTK